MKWTSIPEESRLKARRAIYNRCAYIYRKYGIRIEPISLLARLSGMRGQKDTLLVPVLTSIDASWELESLIWVERSKLGQRYEDPFKIKTKDYSYDQTPSDW